MLAAGAFVIGIEAVIVSGLLPGITSSLAISSGQAGQLITVFDEGYALLAPLLAPRGGAELARNVRSHRWLLGSRLVRPGRPGACRPDSGGYRTGAGAVLADRPVRRIVSVTLLAYLA